MRNYRDTIINQELKERRRRAMINSNHYMSLLYIKSDILDLEPPPSFSHAAICDSIEKMKDVCTAKISFITNAINSIKNINSIEKLADYIVDINGPLCKEFLDSRVTLIESFDVIKGKIIETLSIEGKKISELVENISTTYIQQILNLRHTNSKNREIIKLVDKFYIGLQYNIQRKTQKLEYYKFYLNKQKLKELKPNRTNSYKFNYALCPADAWDGDYSCVFLLEELKDIIMSVVYAELDNLYSLSFLTKIFECERYNYNPNNISKFFNLFESDLNNLKQHVRDEKNASEKLLSQVQSGNLDLSKYNQTLTQVVHLNIDYKSILQAYHKISSYLQERNGNEDPECDMRCKDVQNKNDIYEYRNLFAKLIDLRNYINNLCIVIKKNTQVMVGCINNINSNSNHLPTENTSKLLNTSISSIIEPAKVDTKTEFPSTEASAILEEKLELAATSKVEEVPVIQTHTTTTTTTTTPAVVDINLIEIPEKFLVEMPKTERDNLSLILNTNPSQLHNTITVDELIKIIQRLKGKLINSQGTHFTYKLGNHAFVIVNHKKAGSKCLSGTYIKTFKEDLEQSELFGAAAANANQLATATKPKHTGPLSSKPKSKLKK